jgi:hypothetical protein
MSPRDPISALRKILPDYVIREDAARAARYIDRTAEILRAQIQWWETEAQDLRIGRALLGEDCKTPPAVYAAADEAGRHAEDAVYELRRSLATYVATAADPVERLRKYVRHSSNWRALGQAADQLAAALADVELGELLAATAPRDPKPGSDKGGAG